MTPERWQRIAALLDEVLELPISEQPAAVDRLCASDLPLRADLERLLAADAAADTFLGEPIETLCGLDDRIGDDEAVFEPMTSGTRVGPYRVVHEIGRGGMGAVFLAERADGAFEQRVALKIVHSGPLSDEERHRFLQERQILAALDHPNIARLFDGGVVAESRPYFAMEYLEGVPITRYCAERPLGLEERLRLFVDVCAAVDFAHRHLIVHRDLKPSNILVTADGRVKLLDFGIAKLLTPAPSEAALQTVVHAMTPEYAAPEQIRGGPVTMATDVYGLGVVLYELLTGRLPHRAASPLEVTAAVVQQEPMRPSAMLRMVEGENTQLGMPRVARRLRGDLDTIVLKALCKEPDRRYLSAEALRSDLLRHLAHEPILARGDSHAYRARRFVRRHALGVTAVIVVALSLVGGLVGTVWQARVASRQARRTAAVQGFMTSVLRVSDPRESVGRTVTAREILDVAAKRVEAELARTPEIQADVLTLIGRLYTQLGLYTDAKPLVERALELRRSLYRGDQREIGESLDAVGVLQMRQGQYAAAEQTLTEALVVLARALGRQDEETATTLNHLADVRILRAEYPAAESSAREALGIRKRTSGDRDPALFAESLILLAQARRGQGDLEGASAFDREALEILRANLTANHPDVVYTLAGLARGSFERGNYGESEEVYRQALGAAKKALGPDHPDTLRMLSDLGTTLSQEGKLLAGEVLLREALEAQQLRVGETHPSLIPTLNALARTIRRLGRHDEAARLYREALAITEQQLGPDHPDAANNALELGTLLMEIGKPAEAEPLLRQAVAARVRSFGERDVRTAEAELELGECLLARGQASTATTLLERSTAVLRTSHGDADALVRRAGAARLRALALRGRRSRN